MNVTTKLSVDLTRPNFGAQVNAVQYDGNTRQVEIALLSNGKAWEPPEGVDVAVVYHQPNGNKGMYDKLADGSQAIFVHGNTATILLSPQMLTDPGTVQTSLVFNDVQLNRLTTFSFDLFVWKNPAAMPQKTEDYIRLQWLENKLEEYWEPSQMAMDGAISKANTAATGADAARDTANTAADTANKAADSASKQASAAEAAAGNANAAAGAANTAAEGANTAKEAASIAAAAANEAAAAAQVVVNTVVPDVKQLKNDLTSIDDVIGSQINIFNKAEAADNVYIQTGNGTEAANSAWASTGFINVRGIERVCIPHHYHVAFYDADKVFIPGSGYLDNQVPEKVIDIPSGAVYMRFDINKGISAGIGQNIENLMVIPGAAEMPCEYHQYNVPFAPAWETQSVDGANLLSSITDLRYLNDSGKPYFQPNHCVTDLIKIQSRHISLDKCNKVSFFDENGNYLSSIAVNNNPVTIDAPYYKGYGYMRIAIKQEKKAYTSSINDFYAVSGDLERAVDKNYWTGKRILWLGTSIPEGNTRPQDGYPDILAKRLGCAVINQSLGASSMTSGQISLAIDDDPSGITGCSWLKTISLTQSRAQKQDFIDNWNAWKTKLTGAPDVLSDVQKELILTSGYEDKLDPYLTKDNYCDVYVIDHGWNDNNMDLVSKDSANKLYNDFSRISVADDAENIDTLDPYRYDTRTFRGACNWIVRRILSAVPWATIVFIGVEENVQHHVLIDVQEQIARENSAYFIPLWEACQLNQHKLDTAYSVDADGLWTSGTQFRGTSNKAKIKDGTHPQGWMAAKIADYLEGQFRYRIR